jgi:hypothetical protein
LGETLPAIFVNSESLWWPSLFLLRFHNNAEGVRQFQPGLRFPTVAKAQSWAEISERFRRRSRKPGRLK